MIECKICGKLFEPDDQRFKCCSKTCRKMNQLQHNRRWRQEHKEEFKLLWKKNHPNNPNKTPHFCKICGERIWWTKTSHPVRHDECVLNEIVKTVNSGKRISDAQYQQLKCRGYDLGMFAEEYRKVLKHYPAIEHPAKKGKK